MFTALIAAGAGAALWLSKDFGPRAGLFPWAFGIPVFVDGRGSMGRTDFFSQTDLLVSHELKFAGSKRVRLEANVLNVFNQKTSRHVFDNLNRPRRASSAINLAATDLAQGYNYDALITASPDGQNAYDPRFGMDDLFNPGTQARFSVRFLS